MKTTPKKIGAELPSAPTTSKQPSPATPHPLAGKSWTLEIQHSQMRPSETNPRKEFPEDSLRELAESFKAQGQLQNCLVRPCPKWVGAELGRLKALEAKGKLGNLGVVKVALEFIAGTQRYDRELTPKELDAVAGVLKHNAPTFEIVAGERRWRAAGPKFAKLPKMLVTIRCLSDDQVIEAQYAENDKRLNLAPLEEGEWFKKLIELGRYSAITLSEKLAKSREYVYERMRIARLEGPPREALKAGTITASVAAAVAAVPDRAIQKKIFEQVVFDFDKQLRPVRDIEEEIQEQFMRPLKDCGWELTSGFAYKGAVASMCSGCPRNTRNMTAIDPNLAKGPARCLDVNCFSARAKEAIKDAKYKAKAAGTEVWDQVKHSSDVFTEGHETYVNGEWQKPEKVAGKISHHALAVDGERLVRVWRRSDLEKAGVLKRETARSFQSGYTKSPAERKKELAAANRQRAIVGEIVATATGVNPADEKVLRLLARAFLQSAWSDTIRLMAKRRGIDKHAMTKPNYTANLSAGDCMAILIEGLCCWGMRGGDPGRFQTEALNILGIDAKADAKPATLATPAGDVSTCGHADVRTSLHPAPAPIAPRIPTPPSNIIAIAQ